MKTYKRVGIMAREEVYEKKQVSLTGCQQEVRTWFQEPPTAHQEVRTPRKHSPVPVKAEKVISISEKDDCDQQQKTIWLALEVELNDRKPLLMTTD